MESPIPDPQEPGQIFKKFHWYIASLLYKTGINVYCSLYFSGGVKKGSWRCPLYKGQVPPSVQGQFAPSLQGQFAPSLQGQFARSFPLSRARSPPTSKSYNLRRIKEKEEPKQAVNSDTVKQEADGTLTISKMEIIPASSGREVWIWDKPGANFLLILLPLRDFQGEYW